MTARDYVFVMTYGRSGSTLLMGLLNTIPGYLIRGENDDALRFLFDFHRTCVGRSTARLSARPCSPPTSEARSLPGARPGP